MLVENSVANQLEKLAPPFLFIFKNILLSFLSQPFLPKSRGVSRDSMILFNTFSWVDPNPQDSPLGGIQLASAKSFLLGLKLTID